ncbi:MAG: RNA polymerase sigma factor [Neptuniibacter sp.]
MELDEGLLKENVTRAIAGDKGALTKVIKTVQPGIYALAQRFLWHPQDAEDATQEILIKVITHLSSFRAESRFTTWVYRIGANTLLSLTAKRMEKNAVSFTDFADDLSDGLSESISYTDKSPELSLLLEEVKVGCTLAMLMCLDRKHRLAYILGEIMELAQLEAASVLDISPTAYRKQLSRAREKVNGFTADYCGLVAPENSCRCSKRVDRAIELKRVNPSHTIFATDLEQSRSFPMVLEKIRSLDLTRRAAALYRSHSHIPASPQFHLWLRVLLRETELDS